MKTKFAALYVLAFIFIPMLVVHGAKKSNVLDQEFPPDVFEKVLPSTVRISCNGGQTIGSGSIVGLADNKLTLILTACHVVAGNYNMALGRPGLKPQFYKDITVRIGSDSKSRRALVAPNRYDLQNDLALLICATQKQDDVIHWDKSQNIKPGKAIAAFGFPLHSPEPTLFTGHIETIEGKFFIIDANIAKGNSGGPVIDKYGRMVGMSSSLYNNKGRALQQELIYSIVDEWLEGIENRGKISVVRFKNLEK